MSCPFSFRKYKRGLAQNLYFLNLNFYSYFEFSNEIIDEFGESLKKLENLKEIIIHNCKCKKIIGLHKNISILNENIEGNEEVEHLWG